MCVCVCSFYRFAGRIVIDVPMQNIAKVISDLRNRFHYDPLLQVHIYVCLTTQKMLIFSVFKLKATIYSNLTVVLVVL